MHVSPRHLLAASAAAAAILLCGGGAALANVKAGVDAWQAGNYGAAVREWRADADKGDADAQFNLGQAYKLGRGVPADVGTAQSWFEKAARQGHGQAQAQMGLILFHKGEHAKAMPWIRKGADMGDPRAQYYLGIALFNGDLAKKDWPRAYAMMHLAAAQGLAQASSHLQQMDKHISVADRQKGLALARQLEKAAPAAPVATHASVAPKRPAQLPGKVATTPLAPWAAAPSVRMQTQPPRPAAAIAGGGNWRIQLGAYSNAANARKAWEGLRAKSGALGSLQPHFVPAGAVTRLQAGPLASRAAADKACGAAKAAGAACFPVAS
ncbi:MAG TPA: SPOR domain-containing protein [Allosphingosinicella sp.]|nr:SPOR domain-containing protein [Allosphingosinicella sp.]